MSDNFDTGMQGSIGELPSDDGQTGQILNADNTMEVGDGTIQAEDDLESYLTKRFSGQKLQQSNTNPNQAPAIEQFEGDDTVESVEAEPSSEVADEDPAKSEYLQKLAELEKEKVLMARKNGDLLAGYPEELKEHYEKTVIPELSQWGGEYLETMNKSLISVLSASGLVEDYQLAKKGDLFIDDEANANFAKKMEHLAGSFQDLSKHFAGEMSKGLNHHLTKHLENAWEMSRSVESMETLVEKRNAETKNAFLGALQKYDLDDREIIDRAFQEYFDKSVEDMDADLNELATKTVEFYDKLLRKGAEKGAKVREQMGELSASSKSPKKQKSENFSKMSTEDYIKRRLG